MAPCKKLKSWFLRFSIYFFCGISASAGDGQMYIVDSNKNQSQGANVRYCPNNCVCKGLSYVTRVYCFNVTSVPLDIPRRVKKLDLRKNQLTVLKEGVFAVYQHLEELYLADNLLEELRPGTFSGLHALQVLNLNDNHLRMVPTEALMETEQLRELYLEGNKMPYISKDDFNGLPNLKVLTLSRNQLQIIPGEALEALPNLEFLDFAENNISEIGEGQFKDLDNLQALNLGGNNIANITIHAFFGLTTLQVLELQHNGLQDIPYAISDLPSLKKLSVAFNNIQTVRDGTFYNNPFLAHVDLLGNPVRFIERHVFTNLTKLKILIIPEAKELSSFPNLNGTTSLEFLRIDRTHIQHIPNDICQISSKLKTLDLKSNSLDKVPLLSSCKELRQLQLSGNHIKSLEGSLFSHQSLLHDLLLNNNLIEIISQQAFLGLAQLEILNLRGNRICYIHNDAFLPLKQLIYLNVAENKFSFLPSHGLEHVSQLLTFDNPLLREFPPSSSLPHVHTLKLSYAYHCCQFMVSMNTQDSVKKIGSTTNLQETVVWLPKEKVDLSLWTGNTSDLWPVYQNLTHKFGDLAEDLFGNLNPDYVYPYNLPQMVEDYIEEARSHDYLRIGHLIHCSPQPGPFMPCKDLFDWWTLRCGVWIVFLLSMIGNGAVVFVIIFSRTKMDVPRFLVCNLACADFCMGVYLAFLAVIDASTLGQFKMFALQWQFSPGCQIAGFLGVLSSELSVYTLAVITLERNYAITNAMHLNKRLSITHAGYIMACGWMFSIFTASLPFFGISDYRKFAVCLPFDIETSSSLAYVVFLMAVNGIAFLILIGCYLKMYCAIRGSQAWNSNDSRIAKRMALLVFTDFVCWAPIAFFSLTAAFGLQLVTLEEAKVFTIFVLPLNSCANPFLYAILTKQFKKDCILICKSIEESRVTRGIGRCRHSSNFSNRQTPANTNSALERNSNNGHVVCSCSQGSSDGVAGKTTSTTQDFLPTPLHQRWQLFKLRFLLCLSVNETEPYPSNEYAYAIAEIQKNQQRHSRNLSLSSDNFSTSRSDSWRQKSIPLRMLEKNRRSSWTITRKPSQDSNLSSSRNDSSSNTPSTSTWRVSRSSVSSDMSGNSHQQRCNLGNIRERMASAASGGQQENCLGVLSFPHNSHNVNDATNLNNFNRETGIGNINPILEVIKNEGCVNHALPTSARPKVKLKRQSAVMEEIIIPQTLHTIPSDDNGKSTNNNSLDSEEELTAVNTSEQVKAEQLSKQMQNTTEADIQRKCVQNHSLKSQTQSEKLTKTFSSAYLHKENAKVVLSRQACSILSKKHKDNIEHPSCIRLSRTSSLTNVRDSNIFNFGKTFTNTTSSQSVANATLQNVAQDSKQLCQTHLSQSDNILIKQLPRRSFQDLNKTEFYQELSRMNLLMDSQEDGTHLLSKANFHS